MDVGFSQTNLNTVDSGNPLTLHYSRLNIQSAQSNPYHLQISWLQMHFSKTWKRAAKPQSTACASPTPSPPCFPANTLTMQTSTCSEPSFVSSSIGPSGAACELSSSIFIPLSLIPLRPTSHILSYGNKEGLLMGVALEVMLVLVCQLYPNYSEFDILQKFFAVFAQWPWADDSTGIVIITGTAPPSACCCLVCIT